MVRHITGIRKSRYISMTGVLVTLLSSLALGCIYSLVLVHEGKSSIPWTTGMLLACIVQAIIGIIVSCAHENSRALQGHSVAMLIYILACLVAPSDYVPKAPVGLTIAYEDVNSDNPFWDQIELMASYASIAGTCLSLLVSFIVGTCLGDRKDSLTFGNKPESYNKFDLYNGITDSTNERLMRVTASIGLHSEECDLNTLRNASLFSKSQQSIEPGDF